MDKRKQKSQQIIMGAFFELLKKKEMDKISMNEIAEKANVNRGTIYLNFIDKYDLLEKCIEDKFGDLVVICEIGGTELSQELLARVFESLEENLATIQVLFRHADFAAFSARIFEGISVILDRQFRSDVPIQFLASAITGVFMWWIKNDMPCSSAEVTEELWALLQPNLAVNAYKL